MIYKLKRAVIFAQLPAVLLVLLSAGQLRADEIRVAVASNFVTALGVIAQQYEAASGNRVILSAGSTGRHYAQIKNGAPFDLFFAADARRPQRLEEEGLIQPGSRFTYALGKVVLWSPQANYVDDKAAVLKRGGFRHLAIANPKLAPYGRAAEEILQALGVWRVLQRSAVRGENIGQTFQFVKSGNAELGFVAYSQLKRPAQAIPGSWWEPPQSMYTPITQQAVLLKNSPASWDFLAFVRTDGARDIMRDFGYGIP